MVHGNGFHGVQFITIMTPSFKSICFLVIAAWFFVSASGGGKDSPQESVRELLEAIKNIKTGDSVSGSQREKNRKYSDIALGFLDLQELSRKALGKYWSERSEKEKKEFSHLLSDLFVNVAFPNSGKFFSDLKVIYSEPKISKNQAVVPITVVHEKEGEVGIEFYLRLNSGTWKVVDVLLDGVSMRNNLRSQFYKVIAQKNYRELVRRMEKKLKESKV